MKNLFVLPTPNPSRLVFNDAKELCLLPLKMVQTFGTNKVNIYITDNSEIQQGDWFITTDTNQIHKSDWVKFDFNNGKKIILTTDQDLIKEDLGIQAIDDEFLEWFCSKNGEVDFVEMTYENDTDLFGYDFCYYKIIIPKEESKKQIFEELTPMNNLLEDLKETKVSAKESISEIKDEFMRTQINIFIQKTLDSVIYRIENELLEMEKQQQGYSEEEVKDIIAETWIRCVGNDGNDFKELRDKILEQSKKK